MLFAASIVECSARQCAIPSWACSHGPSSHSSSRCFHGSSSFEVRASRYPQAYPKRVRILLAAANPNVSTNSRRRSPIASASNSSILRCFHRIVPSASSNLRRSSNGDSGSAIVNQFGNEINAFSLSSLNGPCAKTAERAAELFRCLQDDLARGFAVFQSPLRFRCFHQRKHFINVQPEPALANPVEHIICASQQLFARAYEMAEHPA